MTSSMAGHESLELLQAYFERISNSAAAKTVLGAVPAVRLNRNETVGRYLEAIRDIPEGEILIWEAPLIVTPPAGAGPTCLRCLKKLSSSNDRSACTQCGAPVCKEKCRVNYHSDEECCALQNVNANPWDESMIPLLNAALTPLRTWMKIKEDVTIRSIFLSLESFAERRRTMPVGRFITSKIVPLLRDTLGQAEITPDFIHHCCGVFDTNAIKVRNADDEQGRAVMPFSAMLMHECVPNCDHWFAEGYHVVRASTPIPKGTVLSINYTSSMLGTQSRQKHLSFTKLFRCQCKRCLDPTELGTHISSVRCRACKKGLLVPQNPFNQESSDRSCTPNHSGQEPSDWSCTKCCTRFSSEMVNTICRAGSFTSELSTPEELVDRIEDVQRMVGVQHYGVLQLLLTLFRAIIRKTAQASTHEELLQLLTASEHLLPVAHILEPGLTLLTGELLLGNLQARAELSTRRLLIGCSSELALLGTSVPPTTPELVQKRLDKCKRIHQFHPMLREVVKVAHDFAAPTDLSNGTS
ncbi:SET domain-containing protein SmydA-8 isoform X1 [Hyalella azteca]|uniref:SET domain-containing protein SmydA-8 isoform X1 n=1 Tax=Hyalella azteca TaxID=294128 RepID=A0A8B7PJM2_HYAAZ|nr:SET domain-containing protein SmydA-8 isoform X1 [Hyalella azteca]